MFKFKIDKKDKEKIDKVVKQMKEKKLVGKTKEGK